MDTFDRNPMSLRQAGGIAWPALALLLLASPTLAAGPAAGDSDSEKHVIVHRHKAVHVDECPEVKVLGMGGARLLSMSQRAFLGVEAADLTPELREHFGVPRDAGVMLSKILDGSAAEAAGLLVGDVVTRVDGEEIESMSELGRAIRRKEGGESAEIEYWRGGEMYQATATLEARERCSIDIGDPLREIRLEDLSRLGALGIEIGGEALGGALEALAAQDWEEHLKGLEEIEIERIEERMERVQERLERLEERLERDYGRQLERAERELERARERAERGSERQAERESERAEREAERAAREAERAARDADREDGENEPI